VLGLTLVWPVVLGNAAAIVWLWVHGGNVEVTLVVRKTTTTVNAHKTVRRRIVGVDAPI
jgi:hypothetical protein